MPIRERFKLGPVEGVRVGRFNKGVNTTFVLYRWADTLIDAGPTNQWKPVRSFLDEKPLRQLLLTHHHEDHAGNAARISNRYNLTPIAPQQCENKLTNGYKTPLLQRIIWGRPQAVATTALPDQVPMPDGSTLVPLHTPGHARDLHVFHIPDQGWLFSGDLFIARAIRYLRSDEDLQLLVNSIRKALELDFDTLFCPHRGIVEKTGKDMLSQKLDNILKLCQQAQDLNAQGVETDQIVIKLLGPEDYMAKSTRFNFSKRNMITEALKVSVQAA
jgi:glyoxylase-like metal-dependent hydrolase (beta-lactamase superfamily II)